MNNKSISWITPNYFLDVDLPIIKELSKTFIIHWIVLLSPRGTADDESLIKNNVIENRNLKVIIYYFKTRGFSPMRMVEANKIIKMARSFKPDIYYLSESFFPFGTYIYKRLLPIDKCIIACHNVTTPKGARHERWARFYTNQWLRTFKNIQTFSECQQSELKKKYRNKNVLMAHLAIKDYGEPTKKVDKRSLEVIRFLVFGNIVNYKRIDLLIEAVNILYNKGIKNFKVRIAGKCNTWKEEYAPLIKHPELFELEIKRIANEDVANLFVDSHYFVMPYQDIAQSGAMTVAFRYNLPLIASDITQFREFVKENVTGITFHTQDAEALADKMEWVINNHQAIYDRMCIKQKKFVEENFSIEAITQKYIDYFNKL